MLSPDVAIKPEIWKRILEKFIIDPVSGCWNWIGAKHDSGYGRIQIRPRLWPVHRFIYESCHGVELNRKIFVCHSCDNPACINPNHLFAGDALANNRDSVLKGRNSHGEKSKEALISSATAISIAKKEGKYSDVAAEYGVSMSVVIQIKQGKRWKQTVPTELRKQSKPGYFRKLSPDAVRSIKSSPERTAILANQFGVSQTMIRRIKRGASYADIGEHAHG